MSSLAAATKIPVRRWSLAPGLLVPTSTRAVTYANVSKGTEDLLNFQRALERETILHLCSDLTTEQAKRCYNSSFERFPIQVHFFMIKNNNGKACHIKYNSVNSINL